MAKRISELPLTGAVNDTDEAELNQSGTSVRAPRSLIRATATETKTAYESNADTNAFTDAEQTKLAGVATGATDDTTVDAHIADASAAHAATAISYAPDGTIASTNVQAAVQEVRDEAPLISSEDETTGQLQIAVVATLPGSPNASTLYFVTT